MVQAYVKLYVVGYYRYATKSAHTIALPLIQPLQECDTACHGRLTLKSWAWVLYRGSQAFLLCKHSYFFCLNMHTPMLHISTICLLSPPSVDSPACSS